jgi:subtilase family serine protease
VTADKNKTVSESNETNNATTIIVSLQGNKT